MQNLQSLTKKTCTFEIIDKVNLHKLPGVLIRIELPFYERA